MPPLPVHAAYFPSAAAAYGEATFTCPGLFISNSLATALSPYKVWSYRYNVHSAVLDALGLGVYHGSEILPIFGLGNVGDTPDQDLETGYSTYNADIVSVIMNYWISFVRDLSPNRHKYANAPHWESFGDGKNGGRRIVLQSNGTKSVMEVVPAAQVQRCAFWKELAVIMEQ
jgi:carboxylesterase type B